MKRYAVEVTDTAMAAMHAQARYILAGSKSLLLTVDEDRETVWVIALRGEGQLPQPENLPQNLEALEVERRIQALRRALIEAEESGDAGPLGATRGSDPRDAGLAGPVARGWGVLTAAL